MDAANDLGPFEGFAPPPADVPAGAVLELLGELANALDGYLGDGGTARIESGFRANLGVQYRLVAAVERYGLRDTLMEAYVPADGLPVTLNLFDPQPRFVTIGALDDLLPMLQSWLGSEPIQARIAQLMGLAQRAAQAA